MMLEGEVRKAWDLGESESVSPEERHFYSQAFFKKKDKRTGREEKRFFF